MDIYGYLVGEMSNAERLPSSSWEPRGPEKVSNVFRIMQWPKQRPEASSVFPHPPGGFVPAGGPYKEGHSVSPHCAPDFDDGSGGHNKYLHSTGRCYKCFTQV
jgi:hypothetical protein